MRARACLHPYVSLSVSVSVGAYVYACVYSLCAFLSNCLPPLASNGLLSYLSHWLLPLPPVSNSLLPFPAGVCAPFSSVLLSLMLLRSRHQNNMIYWRLVIFPSDLTSKEMCDAWWPTVTSQSWKTPDDRHRYYLSGLFAAKPMDPWWQVIPWYLWKVCSIT